MAEKKNVDKSLVVRKENEVAGFIAQAIKNNLPVETMEKLFALHREAKADMAREAFVVAMSEFQKVCPVITKNKTVKNKDGQSDRYKYASLDQIVKEIKAPLADNNLAYSWNVENKESSIKATVKITHSFGHSEISQFEVPIDKGGFMTEPQKFASALTFAKRYALCNALGILTGEEDTDATDVGKEPGAKSSKSRIAFAFKALKIETKGWDQKQWSEEVQKLTGLPLTNQNLEEVANRLEIKVKENQEYDKDKNV